MRGRAQGAYAPVMTRTMIAAVTLGNGGFEMIEIQQVPIPIPAAGEVRLKVLAAGVNKGKPARADRVVV